MDGDGGIKIRRYSIISRGAEEEECVEGLGRKRLPF